MHIKYNNVSFTGRYPFRATKFAVMFYNIIKKIFRYVIAMFCMIFGYSMTFMILAWKNDSQPNFDSPYRGFVKALAMTLGEYDFDDYYESFKPNVDGLTRGTDEYEDKIYSAKVNRTCAIGLMVVLIMFGSLAMLNLFIAVIISDFEKLDKESEEQRLVNMAQYLTLVEKLAPEILLKTMIVDPKLDVCLHDLCRDEGRDENKIFEKEKVYETKLCV